MARKAFVGSIGEQCLPEVSRGQSSHWSCMSNSVAFDWDGNFGLHWVANLLGDPLGDWSADDILLNVAGSDGHSLGDLLGGVDTHLLGHFTAVRLDGNMGGGLGNLGDLGDRGSMGHIGGTTVAIASSGTVAETSSVPGLSLGFPLDDAIAMALWAANFGGDLLALLFIGDRLLLDLLGVADLLRLWNTVLGLYSLVGDATLGSGHSLGHGLDDRAGYSHCWGMMGKADSSHAMAKAGAVAEASAVPGLSISSWGRSGISHGSGHARISNKLVHGDLV